jgi:hypothetical protein
MVRCFVAALTLSEPGGNYDYQTICFVANFSLTPGFSRV